MIFINIKTEFIEPECEYLRRLCNFTEDEQRVFDMRVKGMSVIEISMKASMSESTVKRRIRAIKSKIRRVL